jgi:hypothetical protein
MALTCGKGSTPKMAGKSAMRKANSLKTLIKFIYFQYLGVIVKIFSYGKNIYLSPHA